MKLWRVTLFRIDEDGSRHLVNRGDFWADTAKDAEECALDSWWDPRLEATGCSPDFETEPAEPPEDICPFCLATRDQCTCEEMGGENA